MDRLQQQLDAVLGEPLGSVRERERTTFDGLLAACHGRVVLFGAGNLGRKSLHCLRSAGIEPLVFADNAATKWGTDIDGVRVLSPPDAAMKYGASALFVVTIWSLGHSFRDTRTKLESLGCSNVVPACFLRWKFAGQLLPDYCQDLPHKLYEQADQVRQAATLWADEYSRQEYVNQIRWRARGEQDTLSPPDKEESYFPDSLFHLLPDEVFIDCGAYVGDTVQRFLERQASRFGSVVALEPDYHNFARLQQWIGGLDGPIAARIRALKLAVGSRHCQVRFKSDGTEGAAIDERGSAIVECVPLDELLADVAPTYIKMDIEGAELDALTGSERIIRQRQPLLSVCVYHVQSDIWRIPLFLRALGPDYRLFLRPHDVEGWQLVCYAVPPHRLSRSAG